MKRNELSRGGVVIACMLSGFCGGIDTLAVAALLGFGC